MFFFLEYIVFVLLQQLPFELFEETFYSFVFKFKY